MLFIFFDDAVTSDAEREFLENAPRQAEELTPGRYIFVRLAVNFRLSVDGKEMELSRHEAFGELRGRQGIAVIDLKNQKALHYSYVVLCLPFAEGKAYDAPTTDIVLGLPDGSLTQRTLIFAVRMHPEGPLSTHGQVNPVLMQEAEFLSDYQASITLQGHHDLDNRFQRISARLRNEVTPQEVCAESWPNYTLVNACFDCVHSWRQSDGHWDAVRSQQTYYGYDIKRGRNGIWYATGLFGRRRT